MTAKRKRASASEPFNAKKSRNHTVASKLPDHSTPRRKYQRLHPRAVPLYNENAQSPLLRLPREIRDQIWTYLYGDLVLHPRDGHDAKLAHRVLHPMRFSICNSLQTPKDLYELSLQGAPSDPNIRDDDRASTWAAPELQNYHFCTAGQHRTRLLSHTSNTDELKVPIVCRQIWEEMSDIVYETCTFAFTHSDDFLNFLSCRKAGLERVRRLLLAPELLGYSNSGTSSWTDLKWWSLKRLKRVRSLDLWIMWKVGIDRKRIEVTDARWFEKRGDDIEGNWKDLQSIVKELRRWNLQNEFTRVIVEIRDPWGDLTPREQCCMPIVGRLQLAEQVRRLLLSE